MEQRGEHIHSCTQESGMTLSDSYDVVWITSIEYRGMPTHRAHFFLGEFAKRGKRCCLVSMKRTTVRGNRANAHVAVGMHRDTGRDFDLIVLPQPPLYGPSFHLLESLVLRIGLALRGLPRTEICIASGPWAGMAGLALKRARGCQLFVYDDPDYCAGDFRGLSKAIVTLMEKRCITNSDLAVCASQSLMDIRQREVGGREVVVQNGGSILSAKADRSLDNRFRFVYVGTLEPWSGVETLVRAAGIIAKHFAGFELVVAGRGPEERKLRTLITQLGLVNRVKIQGELSRSEISSLLTRSDVGVIPFRINNFTQHSYPIKFAEYLCASLPVISTPIDDLVTVIEAEKIGLVAAPSVEGIAAACQRLIESPEFFELLKSNAARLSRNHSWADATNRLMALIEARRQMLR